MSALRKIASLGTQLGRRLGHWPVVLVTVILLARLLVIPGIGQPGMWEPIERAFVDRVAPPTDLTVAASPAAPKPVKQPDCERTVPKDATARSLGSRAAQLGRDSFGDSDRGRRTPFAWMGFLTVLATAGIAMRLGGARAGLITAIVLMSMPLFALQARTVTAEIGTACGASLTIYGLVALSRLRFERGATGIAKTIIDALVSLKSLAAGLVIGFYAGGGLLGLLVPLGAVAVAGGLGVPALQRAIGRRPPDPWWSYIPAALATIAAAVLITNLASELYSLRELGVKPQPLELPIPPHARELFGHAIVPDGCYSPLLGAVWRVDDDLRMVFDSTWEQIAYGTLPWGVLGPIAMVALIGVGMSTARPAGAPAARPDVPDREVRADRYTGALALAWGGGAWIAAEVFQRKAGFTIYAGFPALAIAVGVWLDRVLMRRAKDPSAMPAGLMLVGLFVLLAAVDLGKDIYSFPERFTSLLAGTDAIAYPKESRLGPLPTKLWIFVLGTVTALGIGAALIAWRSGVSRGAQILRRIAAWGVGVAFAGTITLAAFWPYAWHPRMSQHLSSKVLFETFEALRGLTDQLVIMGDLGHAPHQYTSAKPEMVQQRDQIVAALGRTNRVFAIAPSSELCSLHRDLKGKRYYIVEDRNVRNLLLSNRVDGTTDKNPLASMILHSEPKTMKSKPKAPVIFDRRLQLIGWDIPARMNRGDKYQITMYYKVLQPVGGSWKSLMHFDGGARFNGDHEPIKNRCPTATWQAGDYIVDTHTVKAGGGTFPGGEYAVWIGFFTGSAPNWKNMTVSEAPPEMRDSADRVKITSVILD